MSYSERVTVFVCHTNVLIGCRQSLCHTVCVCVCVWFLQQPLQDGTDPDPYVKLYLLPDPQKTSKRKTKAARRTCNPTYNEMVRTPAVCTLIGCQLLSEWGHMGGGRDRCGL